MALSPYRFRAVAVGEVSAAHEAQLLAAIAAEEAQQEKLMAARSEAIRCFCRAHTSVVVVLTLLLWQWCSQHRRRDAHTSVVVLTILLLLRSQAACLRASAACDSNLADFARDGPPRGKSFADGVVHVVARVLDTFDRTAAGPAKAAALQTMLRDKLGPALGQAVLLTILPTPPITTYYPTECMHLNHTRAIAVAWRAGGRATRGDGVGVGSARRTIRRGRAA